MEESIKEKLRIALTEPIEKECQVVYIMVEIRKLLDRSSDKKYKLLKFFCDWVLHIEINNLSPAREILNMISAEHYSKEFIGEEINFMSFGHLQNELIDFFKEENVNLPIEWLINHKKWVSFRKLFANIIKDCPLKIKSNFKPILVEEFKLIRCEEKTISGKVRLCTDWEYKLVDDPTIFHAGMTEDDYRSS